MDARQNTLSDNPAPLRSSARLVCSACCWTATRCRRACA